MSFKQCLGCKATVAESKAYCPDCGAPMDEEQKREGSSEFDSQMKTQNLRTSDQFRLLEQLNNSTFFNLQPKSAPEAKPVENEAKPAQSNPVENEAKPVQSDTVEYEARPIRFNSVDNLTKTIYLTPQAEAKIYPKQPDNIAVAPQNKSDLPVSENASSSDNTSNPRKTFYIVSGIIVSLFFILAVVSVIILGILYWNYWK